MLKIFLRKIISSLMLMTIALFLVSFNKNNFENNGINLIEIQQKIINSESINRSSKTDNGILFDYWEASNGVPNPSYNPISSKTNNIKFSDQETSPTTQTTIEATYKTFNFDLDADNSDKPFDDENFYVKMFGWIKPQWNDSLFFRVYSDDGFRIKLATSPSAMSSVNAYLYEDWDGQANAAATFQALVPGSTIKADEPIYFEIEFFQGGGPYALYLQWSQTDGNYVDIPDESFILPIAKLSFNTEEGSAVDPIFADIGRPFTLPQPPTKLGYDSSYIDNLPLTGVVFDNLRCVQPGGHFNINDCCILLHSEQRSVDLDKYKNNHPVPMDYNVYVFSKI
jgi:hypothetical protein